MVYITVSASWEFSFTMRWFGKFIYSLLSGLLFFGATLEIAVSQSDQMCGSSKISEDIQKSINSFDDSIFECLHINNIKIDNYDENGKLYVLKALEKKNWGAAEWIVKLSKHNNIDYMPVLENFFIALGDYSVSSKYNAPVFVLNEYTDEEILGYISLMQNLSNVGLQVDLATPFDRNSNVTSQVHFTLLLCDSERHRIISRISKVKDIFVFLKRISDNMNIGQDYKFEAFKDL